MATPPTKALVVLAAALALRLAAAARYYAVPLSAGGDDRQYAEIAGNLAEGRGYARQGAPTAYRAPLYPIFLAGLREIGISSTGGARVAQAFVGAGAVWLAFLLGGLPAMALTAFDPAQILLPTSLYCEAFYSALVLLVAWALCAFKKRGDDASALAFGAAVGLSALCRSTLALLPLAALPFFKRKPRQLALALGAAAVVVSPWLFRNAVVFRRLIPFESGVAGPIVYYASEGRVVAPEREDATEPMKSMYATMPRLEWDRYALSLALTKVEADPLRYVRTTLVRAWRFWTDSYLCYLVVYHPAYEKAGLAHWDALALACRVAFFAACGLAAFGAARAGAPPAVWAALLILAYVNLHALGVVFARYHAPFMPLLYVAAGEGVKRLAKGAA